MSGVDSFRLVLFGILGLSAVSLPGSAQQPDRRPAGHILLHHSGRLVTVDPDGKNEARLTEDMRRFAPAGTCRLSPDGKSFLALLPSAEPKPGANPGLTSTLYVRAKADKEPGTSLGVEGYSMAWSPDGKKLACTHQQPTGSNAVSHSLVEVKTGAKSPLKLPDGHSVSDWSADGEWLVTTGIQGKGAAATVRVYRVSLDGKQPKPLTGEKEYASNGRLSPDGKRLLYTRVVPPKGATDPVRNELMVVELSGGKVTKIAGDAGVDVLGGCWSPDGLRVAYTVRQVHSGSPAVAQKAATESKLFVADTDGKRAAAIMTEKAADAATLTLGAPDWR